MAAEYAADKIRMNAIAPGVVLTERVKKLLEGSKDIEKLAATHLLGLGLPIHMADMAVYLASDESAITTGQVISVDSGATSDKISVPLAQRVDFDLPEKLR
jgi:NAD(P)-dependent dehydrogenase (short-subunit alcohol dehydrogenase family)